MIASGLRARLTCVDTQVLPASFAGREFDQQLLTELAHERLRTDHPRTRSSDDPIVCAPSHTAIANTSTRLVDLCGENGEFHTFCYAGPIFSRPIPIEPGEIIIRDRFAYADLLLGCPTLSPDFGE
jgi:diphthamide synthase (EF-2-diphthine--ammonia ligase)